MLIDIVSLSLSLSLERERDMQHAEFELQQVFTWEMQEL